MILLRTGFSGITKKILLYNWALVLFCLVSASVFSYLFARLLINSEIDAKMQQELNSITNRIDYILVGHSRLPSGLARVVESFGTDASKEQYIKTLKRFLQLNKNTFGVGIWFEPYNYRPSMRFFGPYAYRVKGDIVITEAYAEESYNYPGWHWYEIGKNTDRTVAWTDPYFDEYTAVTMVTTTAPFYDRQNRFAGVTTGDIDLTDLQKIVSEIKFGKTGWAFLLSANGMFIADKDVRKVMKLKITEDKNVSLAKMGRKILSEKKGRDYFEDGEGRNVVYYVQLNETGWILCLVMPEKEMYTPLRKLLRYSALITAIILLAASFLGIIIARTISTPVIKLNENVNKLASEHLRLPSETGPAPPTEIMENQHDEIETLSGNFKRLSEKLLEYVAQRDQSENALRKAHDELEQRVIERTGELSEANAKLKEMDRLKSMFIASMSHELRTPLNSVIGFSSILLHEWMGPLNDEQKENLVSILRSGKHLLSLINDVIDVSKIEAGMIEPYIEDFDLYNVVSEAAASLTQEINEKGLFLKVEAIHQQMHTDRRRLLQCVLNLLSNAVKFTERGKIYVGATRCVAQEGRGIASPLQTGLIEITVTDTGIGIREEDFPKLFNAFVRLESPLRTKTLGTGLGLYLTKKLVTEVLKGEIIYISCYSEGSSFTMRVPVKI